MKKMYHSEKYPPGYTSSSVVYEVNLRQYTPEGSLKAFAEHLPRLKKMGIDILWFMPVHPVGKVNRKGSYGSYYSVRDYTALNPDLGSFDEFKQLISQIHKLGMYAIIDWVANHSAWDNVWTESHPEYFSKDEHGGFMCRVKDWSDVIDLNYNEPGLRRAMIDAMKLWVREADIDGFRCDVAMMVPCDFWEDARAELDAIKPVFMLAEAEDPMHHIASFDASYSWELMNTLEDIARGKKPVKALDDVLQTDRLTFPAKAYRLRFVTNHDENSWNGSEFERLGHAADACAVLSYTLPGMPLMYSGQEAELNRKLAFFDKDCIEWNTFRKELFFTKLNRLKHDLSCLHNGSHGGEMIRLETRDERLFAFIRYKYDEVVVVLLNITNSTVNTDVSLPVRFTGLYHNYFDGYNIPLESRNAFSVAAGGYKVFIRKPETE